MESNPLILIADDSINNIKVLGSFLRTKGYKISVAQDGEHVFKVIQSHLPDLILLDIMMPGMDGYEVCRRLKNSETTKDIPVIFLTARTDKEEIIKGFETGAVDYITKPFNADELLSRVNTHIQLKKQKELLNRQNENLQELVLARDKLLSIVAHDLKNPMAGILTMFELMTEKTEKLTEEDLFEFNSAIYQGMKNIYGMMTDLLQWARMQTGRFDNFPRKVDLFIIAEEIIKLNKAMAENKKIQLINNISHESFVLMDLVMIKSIMHNLVSNAIKFSYTGAQVILESSEENGKISFCVKDSGIGMDEENLAKLFKLDKRIRGVGTNGEQGTGLGLLIVKEMIEKNNGSISAFSQLKKGTVFTVSFPKPESF